MLHARTLSPAIIPAELERVVTLIFQINPIGPMGRGATGSRAQRSELGASSFRG